MMIAAIVVIMAGIYYYAAIPAINIHSSETWFFIMIFLVILAVLYLGRKKMNRYEIKESSKSFSWSSGGSWSGIPAWNTAVFTGCKCKEIPETYDGQRRGICKRCRGTVI